MKLPARLSKSCNAFFSRSCKSEILFTALVISFPAFLLQRHIAFLACEAAFFFVFALARRGSVKILPQLILIVFITLFNTLTPFGKVLMRIGEFPITQGALFAGLRRALILSGMVFMSQSAVSAQLSLPGKAGAFLARMFASLDLLTSEKLMFAPKKPSAKTRPSFTSLIDALDERLLQSYEKINGTPPSARQETDANLTTQTAAGWILCASIPAALYALLAVP
jgi:hypothetical protein